MKRKKRFLLPLILAISGGVFLLAAAVMLLTGTGPSDIKSTQPTAVQSGTRELSEIPRVSLEDSKEAYDGGKALFVDVRHADDYAAAHIPGAVSIPLGELESRLNELDQSRRIITYCT